MPVRRKAMGHARHRHLAGGGEAVYLLVVVEKLLAFGEGRGDGHPVHVGLGEEYLARKPLAALECRAIQDQPPPAIRMAEVKRYALVGRGDIACIRAFRQAQPPAGEQRNGRDIAHGARGEVEPGDRQKPHIGVVGDDEADAVIVTENAVIVPFLDAVPGRPDGRAAVALALVRRVARLGQMAPGIMQRAGRKFMLRAHSAPTSSTK